MNETKFEMAVAARAKQRVEDRIMHFKSACWRAYRELTGNDAYNTANYCANPMAREIFAVIASTDHSKDWPPALWETERDKVRKELFSIMDEMQKAFMAMDGVGLVENIPAVNEEETKR